MRIENVFFIYINNFSFVSFLVLFHLFCFSSSIDEKRQEFYLIGILSRHWLNSEKKAEPQKNGFFSQSKIQPISQHEPLIKMAKTLEFFNPNYNWMK